VSLNRIPMKGQPKKIYVVHVEETGRSTASYPFNGPPKGAILFARGIIRQITDRWEAEKLPAMVNQTGSIETQRSVSITQEAPGLHRSAFVTFTKVTEPVSVCAWYRLLQEAPQWITE